MTLKNKNALTYLVNKTDESGIRFSLICSEHEEASYYDDFEQLSIVLHNLKGAYKGEIIPSNGMPVLDAKEEDIPLIIAKNLNNSMIIEILSGSRTFKTDVPLSTMNELDLFNIENVEAFALSYYDEITIKEMNESLSYGREVRERKAWDLMNLNDTIYYLINDTYTDGEIELFTEAKRSTVEENLINAEAYQQNYHLFDDVITALDPSINMSLIDKAEPLGWERDGELDNSMAHQIRELKEEVITLLALKAATTSRVNALINEMIILSAKRKLNQ